MRKQGRLGEARKKEVLNFMVCCFTYAVIYSFRYQMFLICFSFSITSNIRSPQRTTNKQ